MLVFSTMGMEFGGHRVRDVSQSARLKLSKTSPFHHGVGQWGGGGIGRGDTLCTMIVQESLKLRD